ncbi:MAG: DUF421 domain-containing protein [Tabrizicola sp.]|nr:DUF421 domain-containing protein [Tabrizicola sp.]
MPFDLQRMLLGQDPPLFLLEIGLRVAVIWIWTISLLRLVGGRSIAQMSLVEFMLVIALGSAVGDGMFYPEVPLVHAMLVILLVALADKGLDLVLWRWRRAKRLVDGIPAEVMRNGRIVLTGTQSRKLAPSELMELLRLKGVRNLGEVRHAFVEPSGELSVFRFDDALPGLRIVPPLELRELEAPGRGLPACCGHCGHRSDDICDPCAECGHTEWTRSE